ncbi:MAG: hypothetical protein KDA16_02955 [Phycisphaerales bacterium]|nr:hypothetical protein [Phycisphaerales bacterium]
MGMIDGLVNGDSLPVLEAAMKFAARRQTLIQHNIANISTPEYQTMDVSPEKFAKALGEAVDRRRSDTGADRGELKFEGNSEIKVLDNGDFEFMPSKGSGNILFHDRNDRDLERSMQALAENVAAFRVATEFFRGRIELLNAAIRERP